MVINILEGIEEPDVSDLIAEDGEFEGRRESWLRWTHLSGNLLLTEQERADSETRRAESYRQKLHELGVEPDLIQAGQR